MELDQATEQFYEKLSERLKEKGFSTRIIEDGCLEVTSEKIPLKLRMVRTMANPLLWR